MQEVLSVPSKNDAAPRESILLVGGIPQPTGGVTQHVWRLSLRLAAEGCAICDIHPSANKYLTPGVALRVAPAAGWRSFPWMLQQVAQSPAKIVHFHVSLPYMLGVCGPLLQHAARGKFKMLTLHHGDQAGTYRRMRSGLRQAARSALRQFDLIVCLSAEQRQFYEHGLSIPAERLYDASSYIALPHDIVEALPAIPSIAASNFGDTLLVVSGYASPSYRHEQAIQLADELRAERNGTSVNFGDVHLAICLYGQVEHLEYLAKIKKLAATRPWVHLSFGLEFPEFMAILRRAALLLRPTVIDSYGMVVADAIAMGVPAIASDICARHPGAMLFPADDYAAFSAVTRAALADLAGIRQRLAQHDWSDVPEPALTIYTRVLKSDKKSMAQTNLTKR